MVLTAKRNLEGALRLQRVVQDAGARWIVSKDQPERHVQHRHEEADLEARRCLEGVDLLRHERGDRRQRESGNRRDRIGQHEQLRRNRHDLVDQRLLEREALPHIAHLAGVGKRKTRRT